MIGGIATVMGKRAIGWSQAGGHALRRVIDEGSTQPRVCGCDALAEHEPTGAGHEPNWHQGARGEHRQQQHCQQWISRQRDRRSAVHVVQYNGIKVRAPW